MAEDYSVEAFLAREQQELAGIDDEFGTLTTSDTAPPATNGDGLNGFNEQALDLEFVEQPPPPAVVEDGFEKPVLNGGTNHAQLDVQQDETLAAPPLANTLSALPLAQQNAMRRVATPTPPPTREEPAKIRTWREQQKERLEKKDVNEENEKKKLREQAKRELDEWYKTRREQLEKTAKRNRQLEKDQTSERESTQPGQEWERVTRLCEFNPKSAKATKDLSRFRSILLQMKNQPQKTGK